MEIEMLFNSNRWSNVYLDDGLICFVLNNIARYSCAPIIYTCNICLLSMSFIYSNHTMVQTFEWFVVNIITRLLYFNVMQCFFIDLNIPPPDPKIISGSEYFLSGEFFSLNCTVKYQSNSALALAWEIPNHGSKVFELHLWCLFYLNIGKLPTI